MTRHPNETESMALFLRRNAEDRLKTGSAPPPSASPLDRETLARLYAMASDPERSSDALRLLQELQVHQVELDLQREELENNERQMSRELAHYRALFELTPAVCLVVTPGGRIVEANQAAASLLNITHDELAGQMLHDILKPESQDSWRELFHQLKAGELPVGCEMLVDTGGKDKITVIPSGRLLPEGDLLLFLGA